MKEIIALAIPAFSLFIYLMLSAIEFGGSVFSIFPELTEKNAVRDYMNPIWETTTIFLVFALISLFAFFPGATNAWATGLFSILFSFLAVFGLRIAAILLMHYGDIDSFIVRFFYCIACLAAPMLGSLILMYFLIGTWHVALAIYLPLAILSVMTPIFAASSFFRAYGKNTKLTRLARASGTLFFASAAFLLLALFQDVPYLASQAYISAGISFIFILAMIWALLAEKQQQYWRIFWIFLISAFALFFGLFIAHVPYIIYPNVTLASSAAGAASFAVLAASFGVGIIFVIPALILSYRLFVLDGKK